MMKPPHSKDPSDGPRPLSESAAKQPPATATSLPLAEIEQLLRMARENSRSRPADSQEEPLGPGDVLHLRGESTPQTIPSAAVSTFFDLPAENVTDSLLDQAEHQLAQVILNAEPTAAVLNERRTAAPASPTRLTPRPGLTLEDLGDVDLDLSIELGRAELLIEDVLKLREGSVVSLDKLAGDPVDIVANGRLVARGELLVIDGKFGVRLSEVL